MELYKEAGTADDLLAGTSSLKRRQQKRDSRLNKAEKKLLLPAKTDSSDGEDSNDSEGSNMSVDDDPDDDIKGSGDDIDKVASPVRSCDSHTSSVTGDQTCNTVVDKTASSPRHNPTHERTVKGDNSKNETPLAKDGQNSCQEIGKAVEQQIHAYYVSVERLPEIQVNEV